VRQEQSADSDGRRSEIVWFATAGPRESADEGLVEQAVRLAREQGVVLPPPPFAKKNEMQEASPDAAASSFAETNEMHEAFLTTDKASCISFSVGSAREEASCISFDAGNAGPALPLEPAPAEVDFPSLEEDDEEWLKL
jgi:hypothetical protein